MGQAKRQGNSCLSKINSMTNQNTFPEKLPSSCSVLFRSLKQSFFSFLFQIISSIGVPVALRLSCLDTSIYVNVFWELVKSIHTKSTGVDEWCGVRLPGWEWRQEYTHSPHSNTHIQLFICSFICTNKTNTKKNHSNFSKLDIKISKFISSFFLLCQSYSIFLSVTYSQNFTSLHFNSVLNQFAQSSSIQTISI